MSLIVQIGNRKITDKEIIPLLAGYQMLPQLLRELFIDQAITTIECTPEEEARVRQQFYEKNQLNSEAEREAWLAQNGMTFEQMEALATRQLRIEKLKQASFGHKVESYFLSRKSKLDKVMYSLIRTKEVGIAQELYFRIQEGEQSFAELAREYSQGPEAQSGGLIGPVEASMAHPVLTQMLSASQPGRLWPPTRLGEWLVIVRLEKLIPAQLDESMRRQLLNELFSSWLQEQLRLTMGSLRPQDNPSVPASL